MKIPRVFVILICASLSFTFVSSSVDAASPQPFKNCKQLLKKYYWGVAFNRVAAADLANIIAIRPKIYMENKRLDTDKDGVACENDLLQHLPPMVTTTTSSTTTTTAYVAPTTTAYVAPTTTVAARPSGYWTAMWMTLGAPNDAAGSPIGGPGLNVVYGEKTELIFCLSSGENPSTLEVKDGGNWRKVATGFRQNSDAGRCSNPTEPITFSFYWVVDANGTKNYRKNGNEYKSRDLEIKLTTSAGVRPMLRHVGSVAYAGALDLVDTIDCVFGKTSSC